MKKLLILFLLLTLFVSGCKRAPKYRETVFPSEILCIEDFSPYFDYGFSACEEKRSRRVSEVLYLSEPLGKDPIEIKIYQFNGLQSAEEVKADFEKLKQARSDSFDVLVGNAEAFIAYPKLHYYISGYHIEITAGSGNDDTQKALLTNLANISYEKLIAITGIDPEEQTDESNDIVSD